MGIFGASTTVDLQVAEPHVVAGGVVRGAVELGEPDRRARALRVQVIYQNSYRVDGTDDNTVRCCEDVVVAEHLVPDLRAGRFELALPLPPDVPGSTPESVDWVVRAVVDRYRAPDAVDEKPLSVLVPAGQLAAWAESPPVSDPVLGAEVHATTRLVRPGDLVAGRVVLRPVEDLEGRSLRVRLRRVRFDPDDNRDDYQFSETVLLQDVRLPAGQPYTGTFSLSVPTDAPPSFAAEHNEQRWYLEVALDRRLQRDHTASLELVVHTA